MRITVEQGPLDDGFVYCWGWLSYDDRYPLNHSEGLGFTKYPKEVAKIEANFAKELKHWTKKIKRKYWWARIKCWWFGASESLNRQMEYETLCMFGSPLEREEKSYFFQRYKRRKQGVDTDKLTKEQLMQSSIWVQFPLSALNDDAVSTVLTNDGLIRLPKYED